MDLTTRTPSSLVPSSTRNVQTQKRNSRPPRRLPEVYRPPVLPKRRVCLVGPGNRAGVAPNIPVFSFYDDFSNLVTTEVRRRSFTVVCKRPTSTHLILHLVSEVCLRDVGTGSLVTGVGSVVVGEGNIVTRTGSIVVGESSIVTRAGSTVVMTGSIVVGVGVLSSGRVVSSSGNVVSSSGRVVSSSRRTHVRDSTRIV